ncbi:uncharacterized protein LOC123011361 isoform X1 [Tribolium madens]|uniref:uncharacterized protein LOC123011361 isoform X1 n=1 Tax=Tribolium madens TaxID=41895 RepID=UPI001CF75EEC|nr:uncharacterized protein LOC123011361 isoform X1 [Tribolium madens]
MDKTELEIAGISSELLNKLENLQKQDLFSFLPYIETTQTNLKGEKLQFDLLDSLPTIKIGRKSATIMENMAQIAKLEQNYQINKDLLKYEKEERMKVQKEMCNESIFLTLCCLNDDEKKSRKIKREKPDKDFIHRNIELATAMSKLPLTDEEKHQLDQILTNGKIFLIIYTQFKFFEFSDCDETSNGFHLCENDKQRLLEIDTELEAKYPETQHLKSSSEQDFSKNVVLDQVLKEVDAKIATIRDE